MKLTLTHGSEQDILNCKVSYDGKFLTENSFEPQHSSSPLALAPPKSLSYKQKSALRAAYYWINTYLTESSYSPSVKIQSVLEAIYSLEQIQAWELIQEILVFQLNPEGKYPLHQQFRKWGFAKEQLALYQVLLGKINSAFDLLCLNGLGFAQAQLGDYPNATYYFSQCLSLGHQQENDMAINQALYGLGYCHMYWGKHHQAIAYFKQQLNKLKIIQKKEEISFELVREQGRALAGIGYCMYFTRRYQQGIEYNQRSLEISQRYQDIETQWIAWGSLALIYSQLGSSKQAVACFQERLKLDHEQIDEYHQILAQIDLGASYCYQRQFSNAIQSLESALKQSKHRNFIRGECQAFRLLGFIYSWQGKSEQAIETLEKGLLIAQQFHYLHYQSQIYALLSYVYSGSNRLKQSIHYAHKSIHIAHRIHSNNSLYKAGGIVALGIAQLQSGKFWSGFLLILKSVIILPPWKHEDSKILLALIYKRFK